MSEGTKKVEETEQELKAVELSEQDLDEVAGGQGVLVTTSRSNIRNNFSVNSPPSSNTTATTTATPGVSGS